VDLLRRAGRLREALAVAKKAFEQNPEPLITAIMRFQIRLITASDRSAHTVAEARRSGQAAPL
jgi:hypothetical protein